MAELPEISKLSGQMNDVLKGKVIVSISLVQEKCANIPPAEISRRTLGAAIENVVFKGKWIITSLHNGESILLSLGMGADVLYFEDEDKQPDKYQIKLVFSDGTGYTARFWWFGKFYLVATEALALEPYTKDIAIDPFDARFTFDYFSSLLKGKRTQIKALLMNQKIVGGIGNMYMHDILFKAGLHPKRKASDISDEQIKLLYSSIYEVLNLSREKETFFLEMDFYGQKGGFTMEDFFVGYKENKPCPVCGEHIVLIKTGSTSTFICPLCQVE